MTKDLDTAISTKPAPADMRADSELTAILEARLRASLLPGDGELAPAELANAAAFLLRTAHGRARGAMALAIETVAGTAGARRFMRIAIINEDMPFLVDSVTNAIAALGHGIDRLAHPVVTVVRDGAGRIVALPDPETPGAERESMIYIETRRADARARAALVAALKVTLGDVHAAVSDWPAMRQVMGEDADRLAALDRAEGAALLRWLRDGMLTQLGYVLRRRDGSQQGALGICRKSTRDVLSAAGFARAFAWFDACVANGGSGRWPLVVKSNRIAQVHRRVPLDLFLMPVIENGRVAALSVHAGVWTSAALAAPPTLVPRMRAQLTTLMAKHHFSPSGHAGKALVHALTKLPHDLLISFSDPDLERVALTMMSLIHRPTPRLVLVTGPLDRHLFAFVWLPRDALSTSARLEVTEMLGKAAGGQLLDWSLEVEGSNLAQLLFTFDVRESHAIPDEAELDARLQMMLRGWADAVEAELAAGDKAMRAAAIAARYAEAFPPAYRSLYDPAEAAIDIGRLRRLPVAVPGAPTPRDVRLFRLAHDGERRLRLKVYQRGGSLTLSGTVPALENFGFRVIDTIPTVLTAPHTNAMGANAMEASPIAADVLPEARADARPDAHSEPLGSIHDFLLAPPLGIEAEAIIARAAPIEAAMAAVANGGGENDAFNRLIVAVGLSAREANWLRAWYHYLHQAGMSFGVATVVDALVAAPGVARGLIALFTARHQPDLAHRQAAEEAAEAAIRDGLAHVSAINDDRLLRSFRAAVLAMLRTNAFTSASDTTPLAFKFDSTQVPGLPKPVPWREIFVYSGRVEGIHLRAGPVARGGLRWSDRRDDYRTEILGLMKAQRVKNAVIVPTGAKGGFYPKHLPDPTQDRDGWAAEGRASYQLFVRALLSLTDNLVEGRVVHPAGMVVRDGEDPYFVVAADKGTASFSDTANAIAAEDGFWLDDAFASGGSKGYDHKTMGITARGAWLSVERHFRELGVDVNREPVRVVGVGDMSGDVFGNGMLLAKTLKLVAAFDHRHIFLDPDSDPTAAHTERARLFALPRSSWDDYNKALISPGGGVFPRSQKTIPLSPEARAALGIASEVIDPEALIRAILTAPVDLLWFGGIGTYVKAGHESNADVGDPANDAVRIDGAMVRARVIGEGANLGCTQAGRIEYALYGAGNAGHGGRINTDFIDNSAGVDCSDKEVNIKIALASAKRAGRLDEDGRVAVLGAMTDGVAELVLEDNRLQALGLSIAENGGVDAVPAYARLIETFEAGGHLDRVTEGLADTESFIRRAGEGHGLTRPELAVLLSTAKLVLQEALEASPVPDDEGLVPELLAAFPAAMREAFHADILGHRLRREIIATRIANRMINRLGFIHPFELAEDEGVSIADVASAFIAAEALFDMAALWQAIETETMPEDARILLFERAAEALRIHMADLIRAGVTRQPAARFAEALAPGVRALADATAELLANEARAQSTRMRASLVASGAPAALAAAVAELYDLDGAVGLAQLARDGDGEVMALTRAFILIGGRLGLDWAQATAARMHPSDPWERGLVDGLARDFQQMRLDFLRRTGMGDTPLAGVESWLAAQTQGVSSLRAMIERARAESPVTAAMLAQIAAQARNVLTRGVETR